MAQKRLREVAVLIKAKNPSLLT